MPSPRRDGSILLLSGRSAAIVPIGPHGRPNCEPDEILRLAVPPSALPGRVASLLDTGHQLGRRAWILDADLWASTHSIPQDGLAGLSPAEVARIAAYEVEALTGVDADLAATEARRVAHPRSDDQFLIVQGIQSEIDETARLLRRAGTRLEGVAHPVGLELQLADDQQRVDSWRRIEVWAQGVFLVEGRSGTVTVTTLDVEPSQPWQRAVKRWEQSQGPVAMTEVLYAPGLAPRSVGPPDDEVALPASVALTDDLPATLLDLESNDVLNRLVDAWVSDEHGPVALRPSVRRRSTPLGPILTGLIAGAAVAAWSFHTWQSAERRLEDLRDELTRIEAPASQRTELRRTRQTLIGQLREAKRAHEDLVRELAALDAHRTASVLPCERLRSLMPSVAAAVRDDVLLTRLSLRSDKVSLTGAGMTAGAVSAFTARLADADLMGDVWAATPPSIRPMSGTRSSMWSFELEFDARTRTPQAPAHRVEGPPSRW